MPRPRNLMRLVTFAATAKVPRLKSTGGLGQATDYGTDGVVDVAHCLSRLALSIGLNVGGNSQRKVHRRIIGNDGLITISCKFAKINIE